MLIVYLQVKPFTMKGANFHHSQIHVNKLSAGSHFYIGQWFLGVCLVYVVVGQI